MRACLISLLTLSVLATSAQAADRPPNVAEAAVIANYRGVIGTTMDRLSAGGWSESMTDRVDIGEDVQVDDSGDGPFLFYGNMARYYSRANPDDPTAKMQALVTELQTTTDPKKQKRIIDQIQALAANPPAPAAPGNLWITTLHNTGTFAIDGDGPEQVAAPKGVATAFKVPVMHVPDGVGYLLEFGDAGHMKRDARLGAWRYAYDHNDGSPHIENIEIRIEGPSDVVDALVRDFDWTQVDKALRP